MTDLVLGTSDRGARGELRISLCTTQKGAEFVDLRHFEPRADGTLTAGKGLALKADELEIVLTLLTRAQAVLRGARKPQHRTVRASKNELEEDARLF